MDRKSYTGYVFKFCNAVISRESRKQSYVALSSIEAKYVAISEASKEAVFLKDFLYKLTGINRPILMLNESQSAQKLIKNPTYYKRTKHIDTRYHYIREVVEKEIIVVKSLCTNDMIADVVTKGLHKSKHNYYILKFGLS